MYVGIGPETGKRVYDKDAFSYVCERCFRGSQDEKETFLECAKDSESLEDFAKVIVDWFYSGNWLHDSSDNKKTAYIIRFSDNSLRSFFGTFDEAVKIAQKEAEPKGLGFVVN